ncbi:hypothetical protein FRUB_03782 [Fimbriiglobus ruber]|uniref:Uncharacterized protein n=2 Tax=Fimbriiglobus ruber TaxID=1908690 RepID=A0A225DQ24_9BACT|nr:hypothetical protein FRUB_03782 [Fimbriiglobus ruber]
MEVALERLSHWSRVKFAALCARCVQPFFTEMWPEATPDRIAAVERAIALAEQSATDGRAHPELKAAVLAASTTAGRAQIPHLYPVPIDDAEQPPRDRTAAVIASLSAKVAEKAAEAATADPARSDVPAREAYFFAVDAIRAVGRSRLIGRLQAGFAKLAGSEPRKPWWRFWE